MLSKQQLACKDSVTLLWMKAMSLMTCMAHTGTSSFYCLMAQHTLLQRKSPPGMPIKWLKETTPMMHACTAS